MRYRRAAGCGRQGIALVMVLWVLVMLGIFALNFLNADRWNTLSTRNLREETASYYLALSGYHEALQYLMMERKSETDFADRAGNFWVDRETAPITGTRTTQDGEVTIQISDEDSKLNINHASVEQWRKLLQYVKVPDDEIPGIIDSVQDWIDPDNAERLAGAESDYYEGLPEPYKAKNAGFDVAEELSLVKGMKQEYLYGGGEFRGMLPVVTTFGRGGLNINTASTELLEIAGMNSYEIEAVMKQRTRESGGFKGVPQPFAEKGLGTGAVVTLRVEVTARAKNSGQQSRITAIVNRHPEGKGFRVNTVYWRERAEGIRS